MHNLHFYLSKSNDFDEVISSLDYDFNLMFDKNYDSLWYSVIFILNIKTGEVKFYKEDSLHLLGFNDKSEINVKNISDFIKKEIDNIGHNLTKNIDTNMRIGDMVNYIDVESYNIGRGSAYRSYRRLMDYFEYLSETLTLNNGINLQDTNFSFYGGKFDQFGITTQSLAHEEGDKTYLVAMDVHS